VKKEFVHETNDKENQGVCALFVRVYGT